jgi:hypothetical protein
MRTTFALCALAVAGCGLNHGFIRDDTSAHELKYEMKISGQRFIKTASGSATDGSVLCFIPISSEVYKRAMDDLYANADLGPNQDLINLREDHGIRSWFFVYCTGALTISGDVIELTPEGSPAAVPPTGVYLLPHRPAPVSPAPVPAAPAPVPLPEAPEKGKGD